MRYKKKSDMGVTILFTVLGILLVATSGIMWKNNQVKAEELETITQEVIQAEAAKVNLDTKLADLQTQKEQVAKQIEELKSEVENLKKEGITIDLNSEIKNKKSAYLTFDDGPSNNTVQILDFLKANNIKATFFVLGKGNQADIYRRIVDEGHTIAIHSNTHEYKDIYQNVDSFMADVKRLSDLIEKETGVKPDVLRFPGGSNNTISHRYGGKDLMDQIIPAVEAEGYAYFDWNVDSMDAAKGLQDKQVIVNSVLNGAKYTDNAVILMHDAAPKTTTVDALPEIVEGLKEQGFIFEKLTTESESVKFK
ncbi:MAG: polysaccharide deacetylase family protein [Cellulosilyticaceae bacterium]